VVVEAASLAAFRSASFFHCLKIFIVYEESAASISFPQLWHTQIPFVAYFLCSDVKVESYLGPFLLAAVI
jgi:hypothetical protein